MPEQTPMWRTWRRHGERTWRRANGTLRSTATAAANVTPNQSATWEGWAGSIWDFARLAADSGAGGLRVHQLPRAV